MNACAYQILTILLLAIRQRANPRLAIRPNETLKRVSNVGRLGEIPRWIANAEKDEGPLASGYVPVLSLVRQPSLFFCRALNN